MFEVARFNLVARCSVILPRNLIKTCVCVRACLYIHVVARSNLCKNVVLRGSISYFVATRSAQMNAEAANDVDP